MARRYDPPRSILITGASSGLGEALAKAYAGPGVTLALSGRDAPRLEAAAKACHALGAEATAIVLDVAETSAMGRWIKAADDARPLDLVIANAGISAGTGGTDDPEAQARTIFTVNVTGVLNTVHPIVARMQTRRNGQIALVSSVAAFRGLPGSPAYAASKAAVKSYGEGLRGRLAEDGVRVSVICPGFFDSRMTAINKFPMPLIMPAERAAAIVKRGLARNQARIAFPWPMVFLAWLFGALPPAWTDPLLVRAPRKE
ncbi:MAG: SDR family NAD(P)-dependent oxidoreductase [Rhodospirillales bacterium]|jgi:short-subunit dehydrogenase|nr:SDR family NAD(P)-dependent oxidoreductase [Rhodospirillales bacterium]HJO97027.1 SDR family NAD(P)-dependent oxidoreductase [Rhodospirillales bacterium]